MVGEARGEVGAGKEVVSAGSCWSVVDLLALDGDAVDRYAGLVVVQLPRVDCGLTGLTGLVPGSWHPPSPAPLQGEGLCYGDTYFRFVRRTRSCVILILPQDSLQYLS